MKSFLLCILQRLRTTIARKLYVAHHRKRKRWSRVCSKILGILVLCSLCVMTFLVLSAFQITFIDNTGAVMPPYTSVKTSSRNFTDSKNQITSKGPVHIPNGTDANHTESGTMLPDDCFHDLLHSVDPTCDLGLFCTETWRQEDVLCRVFLHQAGLHPGPTQCHLPTPKHINTPKAKEAENIDYDKVKKIQDLDPVNVKDVKELEFQVVKKVNDLDSYKIKGREIVPRIAYYVLVSESCENPFRFIFLHYLSVLSVQRFLRPYAIYVLGNCVPDGYWWSRVVNDVTSVRFVHRPRPWVTKDGKVKWISHLADVIRLQILLVNGGVYVDTDMILVRSVDPLLQYPLTMGLVDNRTGMGNALILATRGTRFLRDWYAGYKDFRPLHFHHNGMWGALRLWKKDPGSVHMESRRFYSPNWFEADDLFRYNDYDLSASYAIHVWHRHAPVPSDPRQFLTLNTTLGKVFRLIYFGR